MTKLELAYYWTSIFFASISVSAIIFGWIVWIIGAVVKHKNLVYYNKYRNFANIAPLNAELYKINDRFANYTNEISDSSDRHFAFFHFGLLWTANRAFKRINRNYEDFLRAYNDIDPQKGKWFGLSPFKNTFSFLTKWKGQQIWLEYEIKDIPIYIIGNDNSFFIYFKLTNRCSQKLDEEQKFYLGEHKYVQIPKWKVCRIDKINGEPNLVIDPDLKEKKYKVCSFNVKFFNVVSCEEYDEFYKKHNPHSRQEIEYYSNSKETDKLFYINSKQFLKELGFIK